MKDRGRRLDFGYRVREEPSHRLSEAYEQDPRNTVFRGFGFQKQYRGQKASWLAIRVLSTDHQKLLEKGLADMGMEIG